MRRWILGTLAVLTALVCAYAFASARGVRIAHVPRDEDAVSRTRPGPKEYDRWGRDAQGLRAGETIVVDDRMIDLGREAFYAETFGNEAFLTDVVGVVNGPITLTNIALAILALKGAGTSDLKVKIAYDWRGFKQGDQVSTGIDVARGAVVPLGMPVIFKDGRLRVGITCAACHSSVDPATNKVIHGAPNSDLRAGLLLAAATNSIPYFMHTDVSPRGVPDPHALEDAVDTVLLEWPPGAFDSMMDMRAHAAQIPSSWTFGNHPYSHSGAFMAGPFQGLSAQNNNVHALNSDSLALAGQAPVLFGMDTEEYLSVLLQNAAHERYRYTPSADRKPSEFLRSVSPNAPALNQLVFSPSYPKASVVAPSGAFATVPGSRFWEHMNAMSAWQNTLMPPEPRRPHMELQARGRAVFEGAMCHGCHAGDFLTNNGVVPEPTVGTGGTRAKALSRTEAAFAPPMLYPFDAMVPLRSGTKAIPVPVDHLNAVDQKLAWGHGGTPGGYKVPALVGLAWSAPYLHDGGAPTLRALLDRRERAKAVDRNRSSGALAHQNIVGAGHEFWVDEEAGYARGDQDALIHYLETFDPPR